MRRHLSYLFYKNTEKNEINNDQLFLSNQIFTSLEDFCKYDLENKISDLKYINRNMFQWSLVEDMEFQKDYGKRFEFLKQFECSKHNEKKLFLYRLDQLNNCYSIDYLDKLTGTLDQMFQQGTVRSYHYKAVEYLSYFFKHFRVFNIQRDLNML